MSLTISQKHERDAKKANVAAGAQRSNDKIPNDDDLAALRRKVEAEQLRLQLRQIENRHEALNMPGAQDVGVVEHRMDGATIHVRTMSLPSAVPTPAPLPNRSTAADCVADDLAHARQRLWGMVERLSVKLERLMGPDSPTQAGTACMPSDRPIFSAYFEALDDDVRQLHAAINRAHELLDRLAA